MKKSLILGSCLTLFTATASAEGGAKTYQIPPQPLQNALEAFSRLADVEMFCPDNRV